MKKVSLLFSALMLCLTAIAQSELAFSIAEKDLLPENVAYDPTDKAFFVSSTRKGKIVRVDKNGKATDFSSSSDDLWQVIGMKVDAANRILWVCSSAGENLLGYKLSSTYRPAGVFKYDLRTGKLLKKFVFDRPNELHFFNDLVIDKAGNVYVTHTFKSHGIYRIQKGKDELEVLVESADMKYPNGIALSSDEKYLFMGQEMGIGKLDLETKKWELLKNPNNYKLSRRESIDGIYFYNNGLIGVSPGSKQVRYFKLSNDFTTLESETILEENHPSMAYPTTGLLMGKEFYYIANTHFNLVNDDGTIQDENALRGPEVRKLKLK